MPKVINQSFLQHALFYHVCDLSLCITSVKAKTIEIYNLAQHLFRRTVKLVH